ncbi:MAG: 3-deoxy-7-phosphoheptulonate synthase [Calditrichia bacterium]
MLVRLRKDISEVEAEKVLAAIKRMGVGVEISRTRGSSAMIINENGNRLDKMIIKNIPAVEAVSESDNPYFLVSREFKKENSVVTVGDVIFGTGKPVIIAGPCAVENESQILETARLVHARGIRLMRGGAFKPRTSPYSFEGLGEEGLKLLAKAREETGVRIVTEVLDAIDVDLVAEYADMFQIGSRNMQNYKLLKAVGKHKKPVLLKRGMSANLNEFLMSAEHIMTEGNDRIVLCERGIRTFVEYSRNTLDLNVVPAVKQVSHLPIIVDPSHGTGRRDLIEPMSLAALAAGADGLIIEVHPHPDKSWSDPEQALSPEMFTRLMRKINHFMEWQQQYANEIPAR